LLDVTHSVGWGESERGTRDLMEKAAWRQFERAVAGFAYALDPTSEVLFDHYVPDRETGNLRRSAQLWAHLPQRPLNALDDSHHVYYPPINQEMWYRDVV